MLSWICVYIKYTNFSVFQSVFSTPKLTTNSTKRCVSPVNTKNQWKSTVLEVILISLVPIAGTVLENTTFKPKVCLTSWRHAIASGACAFGELNSFIFAKAKYSCSYEPYNMSDISVLEVTNNQYLFFISRVFLLCLNWSMVLYPPLRFSNNIPLQYNVFWLKSNTQHIQKLHASRTKLKLDFIILLKVSKNSFTWINFSHKMTLLTVIEL